MLMSPARKTGAAKDAASASTVPRVAAPNAGFGQSGKPLGNGERSRMEQVLGAPLAQVRIHTDESAARLASRESALAVTFGQDIAFSSGAYQPGTVTGDALLAHELAHTLEQTGGEHGASISSQVAERGADQAAVRAALRLHESGSNSAPMNLIRGGKLALRRCDSSAAEIRDAFEGRRAFTPALAKKALDQYGALADGDRQSSVVRYAPTGALERLLRALPPGAATAGGSYNAIIQDILGRVQRLGALESAAASGLSNQAQVAQTQATFMQARNAAAAAAALPVGTVPTPAQVAAQQSGQVAATSIAPAASAMTPAQEAACNAAVTAAIPAAVAYAAAHHPELHLVAADFKADCRGVQNRGARVLAFGSTVAGRRVAVVGQPFVDVMAVNPAYAMSVIVHELFGHPEYGPYTAAGTEYGLTLYDQAAALMPGYTQPTGAARTSETDAYAYQETEIYSLLRSLPYHTNLAPADAALQPGYVDPEPTVLARIRIITQQWEPRIAKALVRGLYQRFRIDPRLTPAALAAFERGVRANFTAAEATDILR